MENERENQTLGEWNIEPFTLIYDVLKNWWCILLGVIAAMLLTYVVVHMQYVPQYSTTATFVVSSKGNSNTLSNLSSANTMAQTFESVIKSSMMKKIIRKELGIAYIEEGSITTQVLEGTNMLELKVTADSPKKAIDMIRVIMDHYTDISIYSVGKSVMDVLQEPKVPMMPNNPLNVKNAMEKAGLAALALLVFVFGFLSYMADTVKREEDIEEKLDARSLGAIAFEKKNKTLRDMMKRKKRALLVHDVVAGFSFVEAYKKLATKVDYQMSRENHKVLVVTSVSENEGKSTVAANLAITLADQSKKVLLVDGDLRRPSQFLIFETMPEEKQEFGEYLKGNASLADLTHPSGIANLDLVFGRNCYASSTEILRSEHLKEMLLRARESVDYVIIDSPPAGLMGDAEVLADYADAVMVVTKQNYMYAEDINDVLDSFREHHTKVLGVVVNGVRSFQNLVGAAHYGRYGRYGTYSKYASRRGKNES